MEAGVRMGTWDGFNFDDPQPGTGGMWTVVKKFDFLNLPGNGNAWTWYAAGPINSGSDTTISIGFKVGINYDASYPQPPALPFDVGYDGLTLSNAPLPPSGTVPSNPALPPLPPGDGSAGGGGAGSGGGGGSGGSVASLSDNDNGDRGLNDHCGCSTIRWGGGAAAVLAALLLLASFRRR
jgi:uncharacterized protein (TIGR03382 family)